MKKAGGAVVRNAVAFIICRISDELELKQHLPRARVSAGAAPRDARAPVCAECAEPRGGMLEGNQCPPDVDLLHSHSSASYDS